MHTNAQVYCPITLLTDVTSKIRSRHPNTLPHTVLRYVAFRYLKLHIKHGNLFLKPRFLDLRGRTETISNQFGVAT